MPTPTPLPPVTTVPIALPDISLWDAADDAITIWNMFGSATAALQIAIIIMIVVLAAWLMLGWIKELSDDR